MDFKVCKQNIDSLENIVVITLYENEKIKTQFEQINLLAKEFEGKYNSIEIIKLLIEEKIQTVCLVGLGENLELTSEKARVLGGNLSRKLKEVLGEKSNKSKDIDILNLNLNEENYIAFFEGMKLGNYEFKKYKTEKNSEFIKNINVYTDLDISKYIEKANLLADSTIIARDLVNEPANVLYPETLANKVLELGKEFGFEVEVYEEDKIKSLKMEAFLSVAKGSNRRPRFIVMRYIANSDDKEVLGLVGKGLTFDTGGYSIKPTDSMINMKTDMAGAASVIGAMCAIAKDRLDKNVVAVIAACENTISGNSYKPGDIIGSMSGKTIEILNTDAEGRLTLADAIYYIINNEKVSKVVDIATLTGAAIIALGSVATAVVTNNNNFYNQLEDAAFISGEKIWKMPTFDEYKEQLKGKEADLKNTGGREAGCITAGLFIGEFVGDTPWLHLDIAGTSEASKSYGYKTIGATGQGVRTLYYLARNKK